MKRPKLIAVLLASGFLLLLAGGVIAASLPSWPSHKAKLAAEAPVRQSPSASPTPSSPAPRALSPAPSAKAAANVSKSKAISSKAPKASLTKKPQVRRSITYVVKPGDNLSVIAAWFKLHGYGTLYDWNRSVIGANPNLIYPGERITISNGVMKLSGTRS